MALDDIDVLDAVGSDRETGEVVLSIIDGWDWSEERAHLLTLEAKLNAYFGFVESGQIAEVEPAWRSSGARIEVIFRHPPPDAALALLQTAEIVARPLQLRISHSIHDQPQAG